MFTSHADNINAQRSLLRKGADSFVPESHGETKPLSRRGEETPVITMVAVTEFQSKSFHSFSLLKCQCEAVNLWGAQSIGLISEYKDVFVEALHFRIIREYSTWQVYHWGKSTLSLIKLGSYLWASQNLFEELLNEWALLVCLKLLRNGLRLELIFAWCVQKIIVKHVTKGPLYKEAKSDF